MVNENEIWFLPKPRILDIDFGGFQIEGSKIVGNVIVSVERPDPKKCGVIYNIGSSKTDETDGRK